MSQIYYKPSRKMKKRKKQLARRYNVYGKDALGISKDYFYKHLTSAKLRCWWNNAVFGNEVWIIDQDVRM